MCGRVGYNPPPDLPVVTMQLVHLQYYVAVVAVVVVLLLLLLCVNSSVKSQIGPSITTFEFGYFFT